MWADYDRQSWGVTESLKPQTLVRATLYPFRYFRGTTARSGARVKNQTLKMMKEQNKSEIHHLWELRG